MALRATCHSLVAISALAFLPSSEASTTATTKGEHHEPPPLLYGRGSSVHLHHHADDDGEGEEGGTCWSRLVLRQGAMITGIVVGTPRSLSALVFGECQWVLINTVTGHAMDRGTLSAHILCAAYSVQQQQWIVGTSLNDLRVLQKEQEQEEGIMARCDHTEMMIYSMSMCIDLGLVVSGGAFGEALVWEANAQGHVLYRLTGHAGAIYSVAIRDRRTFCTAGDDRTVRVFSGNQCVRCLWGFRSRPWKAIWLSGGDPKIAAVAEDSKLRIVLSDRSESWDVEIPVCSGWSCWSVAEQNGWIATGGGDSSVRLWSLDDEIPRWVDSSHAICSEPDQEFDSISSIAIGPQKELFIATDYQVLQFVDKKWKLLLEKSRSKVRALYCSASARGSAFLYSTFWDGSVMVVEYPSGNIQQCDEITSRPVCFCVAGKHLFVVGKDRTLSAFEGAQLVSKKQVATEHDPCCMFTDGVKSMVYFGDVKGRIWAFDNGEETHLLPIKPHGQRVISMSKLSSGNIAVGYKDGTVVTVLVKNGHLRVHVKDRWQQTVEGYAGTEDLVVRRGKNHISVGWFRAGAGTIARCFQGSRKIAPWACRVVDQEAILAFAVNKRLRVGCWPVKAPLPLDNAHGTPIWSAASLGANKGWLTVAEDGYMCEFNRQLKPLKMVRVLAGAGRCISYCAEAELMFTGDTFSILCLNRDSLCSSVSRLSGSKIDEAEFCRLMSMHYVIDDNQGIKIAVADSMGSVSLLNCGWDGEGLSLLGNPIKCSANCLNDIKWVDRSSFVTCSSAGQIILFRSETPTTTSGNHSVVQPTAASLVTLCLDEDNGVGYCAGEEPVVYVFSWAANSLSMLRHVTLGHSATITGVGLFHGALVTVAKDQLVLCGDKAIAIDVPEPTGIVINGNDALVIGMGGLALVEL